MIKITPAILVSSKEQLKNELIETTKYFNQIDIDINTPNDDFEGKITVDIPTVLEEIKAYKKIEFTFHLMVSDPLPLIKIVEKSMQSSKINFIIHQESDYKSVLEHLSAENLGICVKAESKLKEIDFYNQFKEVQLMTIVTGEQGNPFIPEVLDRVEWLKENYYKGIVSLDGSVNLQSASFIRKYEVDRVSVGSFFSKAENLVLNKQKIELALNL